MGNNNLVLLISLGALGGLIFSFLMYQKYCHIKRVLARVQYENACQLLHINGIPLKQDYTQIHRIWEVFRKETPERYIFIEGAVLLMTKQIKDCSRFEDVWDILNGFDVFTKNSSNTKSNIDLVKTIHQKVVEQTQSHVEKLAQKKCHRLRLMGKGPEKDQFIFRFKNELSLSAITDYYNGLNYSNLNLLERKKVGRKKANRANLKEIETATVLPISKTS